MPDFEYQDTMDFDWKNTTDWRWEGDISARVEMVSVAMTQSKLANITILE